MSALEIWFLAHFFIGGVAVDFIATGTYILSDTLYSELNGGVGNSTSSQRNVAYLIAEEQVMRFIGTFLVPTVVTGTFPWPSTDRFQIPVKYVSNVYSVFAVHESGCECGTIEYNGCAFILDGPNGVISIRNCGNIASGCAGCGCASANGGGGGGLRQFRIAFEAGHPQLQFAGSAKMALVKAAEAALNQIIDPSKALGGPGDPGLTSYSDSGYSQSMTGLKDTPFGGSPEANYVARLLKPFRHFGVKKFGR